MDTQAYYNPDGTLDLKFLYTSFPLTFKDHSKRREIENYINLGMIKSNSKKDILSLIKFLNEFIEISQQDKDILLQNLGMIKSVRKYEYELLENRRDGSLELRGTPNFNK